MTPPPVLVIGGTVIDRLATAAASFVKPHTSNIGVASESAGGSARNVAENLARLGASVTFVSRVGADRAGLEARETLTALGVDVSHVGIEPGGRTATYTAIYAGDGTLMAGIADMDILARIMPDEARAAVAAMPVGTIVYLDANLSEETIAAVVKARPAILAANVVSLDKIHRLRPHFGAIDHLFMNVFEAGALTGQNHPTLRHIERSPPRDLPRTTYVTGGIEGALVIDRGSQKRLRAIPSGNVTNENGAGDAFCAATLWRIAQGDQPADAARHGLAAGSLAVESTTAVNPALSPETLARRLADAPETAR